MTDCTEPYWEDTMYLAETLCTLAGYRTKEDIEAVEAVICYLKLVAKDKDCKECFRTFYEVLVSALV